MTRPLDTRIDQLARLSRELSADAGMIHATVLVPRARSLMLHTSSHQKGKRFRRRKPQRARAFPDTPSAPEPVAHASAGGLVWEILLGDQPCQGPVETAQGRSSAVVGNQHERVQRTGMGSSAVGHLVARPIQYSYVGQLSKHATTGTRPRCDGTDGLGPVGEAKTSTMTSR